MTTVPETSLSHTERARAVLEHIRGIKELIAGFTFPGDPDPRTLNFAKSIPDAFLEIVAVAIEASEDLARSQRVQPDELRDVADFARAFLPVAGELGIMHRSVLHTIAVRRAGVGTLALQVYQLAKALARKTTRPILIPHLENMRQALGMSRKTGTAEPAPPAPAPAPRSANA
jgi:hypothetical protein